MSGVTRLIVALTLLVGVFGTSSGQLTPPEPFLTLVSGPQVQDDTITLGVRVNGIDPRQAAALSEANFSVSEPFIDFDITPQPVLPVTMGVMINLSINSELVLIQRTLRAYFDAHYRSGDTVIFSVLSLPEPYVVTANSRARIDEVIDGLQLSTVYYSVGEALPALAEMLAGLREDDPQQAVMGLLVTSFINTNEEVSSVDAFAAAGIPLHIVQAHTYRGAFAETLRMMALRTGGIFVNNQAGALVTGEAPAAVGALKVLYDAIDASRITFDVTYRSTALDLTRTPSITLSLQLTADLILTLPFTYERQFAPPVAEFANPSISAMRRPSRLDGGGTAFDIASQEIAVYVRFPDDVPRRIEMLEFYVADLARNVITQSLTLTDPRPDPDGAYRMEWPLDDYAAPGTNTPVVLHVRVTDELGLTTSIEQDASVMVAALPPLPTATFTPVPTATLTPVPPTATPVPPTPIPTAAPAALRDVLAGGALNPLTLILAFVSMVALVLVAILLLRMRYLRAQLRQRQRAYEESLRDMPTPLPEDSAEGEVEDARVLGRLIVKRGLPPQEIVVNMPQFVIGRGEEANLVIDAPFISPRHCILTYANGRFLLRDLGSKNGTFINGERIAPERDTIVPNGSEVEITRQIVFELWDPDTVVRVEYQMDDAHTERLNSRISTTAADSVAFPSALGIRAADDDDDDIGDDYSPI